MEESLGRLVFDLSKEDNSYVINMSGDIDIEVEVKRETLKAACETIAWYIERNLEKKEKEN